MRHLEEVFNTLECFKRKLNPSKCIFSVSSGIFLGFIVSKIEIEADLEQIRAFFYMKTPRLKKELHILNGRLATLNQFISKASDICLSFFKTLKGIKDFVWSQDYELAF